MKFYFPHPRLKMVVMLLLSMFLAFRAVQGFVVFIVQPLAHIWYCWWLNQRPDTYCTYPSPVVIAIIFGTVAMEALIAIAISKVFKEYWPSRKQPPANE